MAKIGTLKTGPVFDDFTRVDGQPKVSWNYNPPALPADREGWRGPWSELTWRLRGSTGYVSFHMEGDNNKRGDDMRVAKVQTVNGWLVQAFMTINGKEVIVAEDTYSDDAMNADEDPVDLFTATVVSNLRAALDR